MIADSQHHSIAAQPIIITGNQPITTVTVTIAKGQKLKPYSVLGRDNKGQYRLSDKNANDGSEVPDCVLPYGMDTTSKETTAGVYTSICLNPAILNLGPGHTTDTVFQPLRERGILLQAPSIF
ncbi:head decoration protein [Spartinivicinus marinus]|uniref:head decoration protein n=1 Tax=Spartinivicinus marinus TaxID=2994442 RepID=UPI002258C865|nr:head decoration protein [Spartinivicinus marinus]MCX4025173.1 head decoration protein [Spartinivicinus marinus]